MISGGQMPGLVKSYFHRARLGATTIFLPLLPGVEESAGVGRCGRKRESGMAPSCALFHWAIQQKLAFSVPLREFHHLGKIKLWI